MSLTTVFVAALTTLILYAIESVAESHSLEKDSWEKWSYMGGAMSVVTPLISALAFLGVLITIRIQARQIQAQNREIEKLDKHREHILESMGEERRMMQSQNRAMEEQVRFMRKQVEILEEQTIQRFRARVQISVEITSDYYIIMKISNVGFESAKDLRLRFDGPFFEILENGAKDGFERGDVDLATLWSFTNTIPDFTAGTTLEFSLGNSKAIQRFVSNEEADRQAVDGLRCVFAITATYRLDTPKLKVVRETTTIDLRQFRRTLVSRST